MNKQNEFILIILINFKMKLNFKQKIEKFFKIKFKIKFHLIFENKDNFS